MKPKSVKVQIKITEQTVAVCNDLGRHWIFPLDEGFQNDITVKTFISSIAGGLLNSTISAFLGDMEESQIEFELTVKRT